MNLSKSLYTKAIQCPKSLWLKKYKPEVLTPPDASALARFETGNVVGDLACELFPGGREIPYDSRDFKSMAQRTQAYLEEGVENIYEATFIYDGIVVMVDILRQTPEGLALYEVKSSTDVKPIYLHDVSIQLYVLESLGYTVRACHVVHINSGYVRDEMLELDKLFMVVDVSDAVQQMQASIPQKLEEFKTYLSDSLHEPDIDIGKHCNHPYECDAKAYCWKTQRHIPEYSVFNIFNLGSKKQQQLYAQNIIMIEDIPDDFAMTSIQKQKVDNWKMQRTFIDHDAIAEFLETLNYPLYYLDFETFVQAIPLWRGVSPYQQIPFQYSLHIEDADGTLAHREFLAQSGSDPRRALAEKLVADIPCHVDVLAYNMSFEKRVIASLATQFEDLSEPLMCLHDNIKDLMIPFQKGHYATPLMKGSYSIKYVLPALVPQMEQAYKQLEGIQNGGDAMNAFASLHDKSEQEQKKVRAQLLKYCELDTLAMVRVLGKLKKI
ncbi:DUF2779 domain-containing protein [Sulfurospirillum sp. 1612]|uniref:DUF2779 domain-containing protein n=1 Tax=Sulfurospirillum sp. 1612 TaxID=3094835 RepID=UPI002F91F61F